jgi:hypothetical protein
MEINKKLYYGKLFFSQESIIDRYEILKALEQACWDLALQVSPYVFKAWEIISIDNHYHSMNYFFYG